MQDVKPIVAENLALLRKGKGLTQAQLAKQLNYSDKAVSRWEQGDTLPDINVLCEVCDFYGVSLDNLVHPQTEKPLPAQLKDQKKEMSNQIAMCALVVSIVWLIATLVFVYSNLLGQGSYWQAFVWAVPASCLVLLRMTRVWSNLLLSTLLSAGLVWSLLASIYIQFLSYNFWLIFIIGVPAQIIIILWDNLRRQKSKNS